MHPDASRVHDRQQTRSFFRSLIDRRGIGLKDGRRRGCANYVPRRKAIPESSDFHPTMHIYIYRDFSPPGEKESFNRVLPLPDSFATLFWRKLVELELTWIRWISVVAMGLSVSRILVWIEIDQKSEGSERKKFRLRDERIWQRENIVILILFEILTLLHSDYNL